MNDTEFVRENPENSFTSGSFASISSARAQTKENLKYLNEGGSSLYKQRLEDQKNIINNLQKSIDLYKSEQKALRDAEILLQRQDELEKNKLQNSKEYLDTLVDVAKMTSKLSEIQYDMEIRSIKNSEDEEEVEKRITKEFQNRRKEVEALRSDIEDIKKTSDEASKSMVKAFSEGLSNVKSEIKDLLIVKGVGDLTGGIFDKSSSTSFSNLYKGTSAQFGVTHSEFNSFKNSLTTQLMKSDNFFNFGWKDTAEYISNLGALGITSQEMAEQQYLAVMQGTKYLGLTTDTQAKILRIARNTNNMDLLNDTNKTMVQIMNAQLGVSKEQLDKIANSAADMADISTFLGGTGQDTLQNYIKVRTAVEKEYGVGAATGAENILKAILSNPANNQYLNSGFLGTSYMDVVNLAQNGRMDEAYKLIIESVKNSKSTQVAGSNLFAMNSLGADSNITAIANSNGSMSKVNDDIASINSASSDIAQTIREFNKDWSDKILNAGSNILSLLPFSEVLTLQNAYYALALVELCLKIPSTMKLMHMTLKQIAFNTGASKDELDMKNGTGLGSNLLSGIMLTASIMKFISDFFEGATKSEEWGTSKTASGAASLLVGSGDTFGDRIGGNLLKYGLAGGGIGLKVGHPIIGTLLGLAAGTAASFFDPEDVANFFDKYLGFDLGVGSSNVGAAPHNTPAPMPSTGGKGAASSNSSYPWSITSRFGPRTLSNGDNNFHYGVDWGVKEGTPIGAPMSGTIQTAITDNRNTYPNGPTGAGSGIYLVGDDGVTYQFWHLSHVGVSKGQKVGYGQFIGLSGNTGYSTGAHLHYGTKVNGSWVNPLEGHVTQGLFNASGSQSSYLDPTMSQNESNVKDGETLLQTVISADTLSGSPGMGGPGGNDDVVYAINNGFAGLNDKLEELSSRQDNQEEILKQLTSTKSTAMLRY